jgi:hypothetical protein
MSFASLEGDVGREASLLTPVVSFTEDVDELMDPESPDVDVASSSSEEIGDGALAGAFAALSAGES